MDRGDKKMNAKAPAGKGRRPMTGARSYGKPGQKPGPKPGRKPGPRPGDRPGQRPARRPAAPPPAEAQADQPLGLPVKPALGQPGAKPARKPSARPPREPGAKPARRPSARPARKPLAGPSAKPVRRPAAALAAPKPDLLVAAKRAWQPALDWCQKELRNQAYTDESVVAAVKRFQQVVQSVLSAPDAAGFQAAQRQAAETARAHPFLRWAPVPAKLPEV